MQTPRNTLTWNEIQTGLTCDFGTRRATASSLETIIIVLKIPLREKV